MIKYSIETLYHFNCSTCNGYWSTSDKLPSPTICPHCGYSEVPETMESNKHTESLWADFYFKKWQEASRGDSLKSNPNASESLAD